MFYHLVEIFITQNKQKYVNQKNILAILAVGLILSNLNSSLASKIDLENRPSDSHKSQQVCVQPRLSAANTTLPSFAAERRAAVPCCRARLHVLRVVDAGSRRSTSPAHRALNNKPAGRICCCRLMGQTYGQTDRWTLDRFIDPARHTVRCQKQKCASCQCPLFHCRRPVDETICLPPMAVRRQKSRRIYVRPRTGPQSARLWWPVAAKLQTASVPIASAPAPWDRQTDGFRCRLMSPYRSARGIKNN